MKTLECNCAVANYPDFAKCRCSLRKDGRIEELHYFDVARMNEDRSLKE